LIPVDTFVKGYHPYQQSAAEQNLSHPKIIGGVFNMNNSSSNLMA